MELREWMHRQHFNGEEWCPYGQRQKRLDNGLETCEAVGLWSAYTISFYFAMTTLTTVGFGDVYGENDMERVYCVLLQLMGTVVFATIMSQLSSVLANLTSKSRAQEDKLETVRRFCSEHHVNHTMTRKCLEWVQFQDAVQTEESERLEVLESLPRRLQAQLALMLHSTALHAIPVLHRTGSDFLAQLAMRLGVELKSEGDTLLEYGAWSDTLYIVVQGTLQVQDSQSNVLTVLGPGDFIGETQVLRPWRSEVTVVSVGFAQLKTLRHKDLCRLARRYPEVNRHFRAIAKRPASGISISGSNFIATRHQPWAGPDGGEDEDAGTGKVVLRWLLLVSRSLCAYYATDESNRLVNLLVQFSRHVADNTKLDGGKEGAKDKAAKVEWSSSDGSENEEGDFYDEAAGGGGEPEPDHDSDGDAEAGHEDKARDSRDLNRSFRMRRSWSRQKSGRTLWAESAGGKKRSSTQREQAKAWGRMEGRMEQVEGHVSELKGQVAEVQRGIDHVVFMLARHRLQAIKAAASARGDPKNGNGHDNGNPLPTTPQQHAADNERLEKPLDLSSATLPTESQQRPEQPFTESGNDLIPSVSAILSPTSPRPSSVEVAQDYAQAKSATNGVLGEQTRLEGEFGHSASFSGRARPRSPLLSTMSGLLRSSDSGPPRQLRTRQRSARDPAHPSLSPQAAATGTRIPAGGAQALGGDEEGSLRRPGKERHLTRPGAHWHVADSGQTAPEPRVQRQQPGLATASASGPARGAPPPPAWESPLERRASDQRGSNPAATGSVSNSKPGPDQDHQVHATGSSSDSESLAGPASRQIPDFVSAAAAAAGAGGRPGASLSARRAGRRLPLPVASGELREGHGRRAGRASATGSDSGLQIQVASSESTGGGPQAARTPSRDLKSPQTQTVTRPGTGGVTVSLGMPEIRFGSPAALALTGRLGPGNSGSLGGSQARDSAEVPRGSARAVVPEQRSEAEAEAAADSLAGGASPHGGTVTPPLMSVSEQRAPEWALPAFRLDRGSHDGPGCA